MEEDAMTCWVCEQPIPAGEDPESVLVWLARDGSTQAVHAHCEDALAKFERWLEEAL